MIREAYAAFFKQQEADNTRDTKALHVSDYVDCDRAVWARRNGETMITSDDDTLRKFALGLDVEWRVGNVLKSRFPEYTCVDQELVLIADTKRKTNDQGHLDFFMEHKKDASKNFVVEVKSTTFFPAMGKNGKRTRQLPEEAKFEHRVQCAAYAIEKKCKRFCVVTVCRESGMLAEHWYDTERYIETVRDLRDQKRAVTSIGASMPPATPPSFTFNAKTGKSWRCSYCSFAKCERNANPAALSVLS